MPGLEALAFTKSMTGTEEEEDDEEPKLNKLGVVRTEDTGWGAPN